MGGKRLSETDDPLRRLEERVVKTFELIKKNQEEKLALQQDLEKLRVESRERSKVIEAHERELVALRREREEVRGRIEKLLQRIDALTSPESGG
jgi:chromosome segregation ATPase